MGKGVGNVLSQSLATVLRTEDGERAMITRSIQQQLPWSIAVLALAVALAPSPAMATVASAKEFDVTGTIDCGARSGHKCDFADWSTGPVIGVLTEDISGTRE